MKNKIPLSTVPFLSALMGVAFGKGENKTVEAIAAPTTEVVKETTTELTTTAPTSTASTSSEMNEISLADTQRVGREDTGYVNIPKD